MKEFMLYIRNDGSALPADKAQEFLKACETYIEGLKQQGKLIGAQPLEDGGTTLSRPSGKWREDAYSGSPDYHAGYYHIRAVDFGDAVAIAKDNPEFAYRPTARIEVRAIKTGEESTGYVYPTKAAR